MKLVSGKLVSFMAPNEKQKLISEISVDSDIKIVSYMYMSAA